MVSVGYVPLTCAFTEVECPNVLDELDLEVRAGKDTVYASGTGLVYAFLGSGNDKMVVWSGSLGLVAVYGEPGNDKVTDFNYTPPETTEFHGGRGSDTSDGPNKAFGGKGDDTLKARGDYNAGSTLLGGPGSDFVMGRRQADDLHGGPGPDRIRDRGGNGVIYGGAGQDHIDSRDRAHQDINCGPDRDTVRRDWRDQLYRCEVVRR